jgi:hypothetical protein
VCCEHDHGTLTQLLAPQVQQLSLFCQPVSIKQVHQVRQPCILGGNVLLWIHHSVLLLLLQCLRLLRC